MRFNTTMIASCLFLLIHSAQISAGEITKVEWQAVPGATLYKGTIESNGADFQITTDSTWILIGSETGTVKKIDAWSPNGPLNASVEVKQSPLQNMETIAPSTSADPDSRVEPVVQPDTTSETPPEASEQPVEAVLENPEASAPATPEAQPEEDITSFSSLYRIGVSIGMGRQWIKSEMGISEFKGDANIGGTILSGSKLSSESPIWYEGEFSAHNFTTETMISGAVAGSKKEETNMQMRLRILAFYNFFQEVSSPYTGVSLGGGLQYLKHPLLIITDKLSGAASMKTESALALNLGVRYSTLISRKNLLITGFDTAPLSFSKDVKTMSNRLYTEWLHLITPSIYTNLSLQLGREKLTANGTCPAVTNCAAKGVTDSDIVQIRMGLAVGF